jgi:hypothetical protein
LSPSTEQSRFFLTFSNSQNRLGVKRTQPRWGLRTGFHPSAWRKEDPFEKEVRSWPPLPDIAPVWRLSRISPPSRADAPIAGKKKRSSRTSLTRRTVVPSVTKRLTSPYVSGMPVRRPRRLDEGSNLGSQEPAGSVAERGPFRGKQPDSRCFSCQGDSSEGAADLHEGIVIVHPLAAVVQAVADEGRGPEGLLPAIVHVAADGICHRVL